LAQVDGTLVLYESPYRIAKLLAELDCVFPQRSVVLAREITKKFEEWCRGKPAELIAAVQNRSLKGEFVVLIAPAPEGRAATHSIDLESQSQGNPASQTPTNQLGCAGHGFTAQT